jgi:DNA-directed RNA polymerase subunit RPC12/RpoP
MPNPLSRTLPCAQCGAELIWTQNAWKTAETGVAAYRCENGHVVDPAVTRQCPSCGVHDTALLAEVDGHQQYRCGRCGHAFSYPP